MPRPQPFIATIILGSFLFLNACSEDFLEITPNGVNDESVLATHDGVDALLIGAYSMMDGAALHYGWAASTTGWIYSSIRAMESNKGSDAGDPPNINPFATFSETGEYSYSYLNTKWRCVYESISRCNATLRTAHLAYEKYYRLRQRP